MTVLANQHYSTSRTQHRPSRARHHSTAQGGQFFLGNIDKALKREEVYDFLTHYEFMPGRRLYVSRFDMPKVSVGGADSHGRPINCAGYAFVHVKDIRMARAMLAKKTVKIGNLYAEIKPYDQAKREQSTQRHIERSKQTSAAPSVNGDDWEKSSNYREDWTIENDDEFNDVHHAVQQSKIGIMEKPKEIESAYVSETEDNVSVSSHFSANRSPRVRPSPVKLDETVTIDAVMKQMCADDITPTVERINERLRIFQAQTQAQANITENQMNPIRDTTSSPLPELNTATQKTNLILASTQVQQQTLPLQTLAAAPATLYVEQQQPAPVLVQQQQPISQQPPIYNYQNSPFYHSINQAAEQLISDSATFNAQFYELKQQWLQYYQQNPVLAVEHYHMTADNYNQALVERVKETTLYQ